MSSVTEEMGKPGSDAGMPAIEDSEVGKMDDNQFGKREKRKRHVEDKEEASLFLFFLQP